MSQTRTHELEGRKREERVGEPGNVACHKRGLTNWRGGRGRSGLVSLEMRQVTNEDSQAGGEEGGGAGWRAWKCDRKKTRTEMREGMGRGESVGEHGNGR